MYQPSIPAPPDQLRDEPDIKPDAESSLLVIDRQVDRIARIVRELLGFVRQREVGGANPQISAVVQSSVEGFPDELRLLIEDDGGGLGADPEQLFQEFFTTKTTGTGLGLTIARRTAEVLRGSLVGENRFPDGRGARFVLTLPLAGVDRERR